MGMILLNGSPHNHGAMARWRWLGIPGLPWPNGTDPSFHYDDRNNSYDRFIAAEQPPHLKAIAPWEGMADFYNEGICRGGIPNPAFWDVLSQGMNGRNQIEDVIEMIKAYPLMNEYWRDKNPGLSKITVPMYVLASYSSGLHTQGSIRGFKYSSSKEKW